MKLTCYAVALVVFAFGGLQLVRAHSNPPQPPFCFTPNGCVSPPDVQWASTIPFGL